MSASWVAATGGSMAGWSGSRACRRRRRVDAVEEHGVKYATGGWWQGGVKRAVDEFVASGAVEVVVIRNRQFVLRRR
jgi:hypothetical protein